MSERLPIAAAGVPADRLLLRVDEAARLCGIGRSKMYELVASSEVPSIAIGRSRRVPVEGLRRWVEAQTTAGRHVA